jgi:hypothetical protein
VRALDPLLVRLVVKRYFFKDIGAADVLSAPGTY